MKASEKAYLEAAALIGCEVEVIKAVALVESNGSGFNPDGTPKTLFEGHWFHKLTKGAYTGLKGTEGLSYARWTRAHYGKNQEAEKKRLEAACMLNREAALLSTSWGAFQIMGFNYAACGYDGIQSFVNAMYGGPDGQLNAFVRFIKSKKLEGALIKRDWAYFASRYNGPGYKVNQYDTKMQRAYLKFKGK